jgi:hypothetical protein
MTSGVLSSRSNRAANLASPTPLRSEGAIPMDSSITWHYDFTTALDVARKERRFVLADFSKEH